MLICNKFIIVILNELVNIFNYSVLFSSMININSIIHITKDIQSPQKLKSIK